MSDVPDEVRALAAERAERRAARDFTTADELRDRLEQLGFRVVDVADGFRLEPVGPAAPARSRASDVPSVLDEPPSVDVSVHWVLEGWPDDVRRALTALRRDSGGRRLQFVVADVTDAAPEGFGEDVEHLLLERGTGWAAARNAGLRRSHGRIVVAIDGSVEPTGDVLSPLERALEDDGVGICGPFGISTRDLHAFSESPGVGPERAVDAIEGYCMAFRRDLLARIGGFDERFRWYRTADIEFSFRAKDAGYRCVVVDAPVVRHEHRIWDATPEDERERLSKRNYYRFLERFRGRTDLLVEPPG